MASHVSFALKSCFSFVDDRVLSEFLYRNMFSYGNFLWESLCKFMLSVFWFIAKYIGRGMTDHNKPQETSSSCIMTHSEEDDLKVSKDLVVSKSSMNLFSDDAPEDEVSNFPFSLSGSEFKDSKGNSGETEVSAFLKADFSPNVLKYQFTLGKNVLGFMEEPQAMSFTIQEMFMGSNEGKVINSLNIDGGVSQNEDLQGHHRHSNGDSVSLNSELGLSKGNVERPNIEEGSSEKNISCSAVKNPHADEILEEKEACSSPQNKILILEEIDDVISYEFQLSPRNQHSTSDLSPDSDNSSEETLEVSCPMITGDQKPEVLEGNETQEEQVIPSKDAEEFVIELKSHSSDANEKDDNFIEKEAKLMDESLKGFEEEEESFLKVSMDSDSDAEDEFDILLEHQQLVKQMKMERKNSKLKGLPTISEEEEECETPKILADLQPLKIDNKFEYRDIMGEIHKFYKSYAEKVRKLDILNYQTLHAISFLQLKDSQLSMPSKTSLASSIKGFTLPSFPLFKQHRIHADPSLKSIHEMHRDLELVYVGQVCLSWEILLWQYGKVKELLEHDSGEPHSYNQISTEFQQFQVLLERFMEDERFQGPRIQHYVKSRCFFRGLVQVPCIKDDCPKNMKESTGDQETEAISVTMLAEAIKDSMQIFWEFIHADKEEAIGFQSSADSQLLINVRTYLEKKERKIKDIQRSRNCIVKKFQKHPPIPNTALLISQVELKLVARVLNLSRLNTDHLIWCQKKLNNISIVSRKVEIEPSFLLFPC